MIVVLAVVVVVAVRLDIAVVVADGKTGFASWATAAAAAVAFDTSVAVGDSIAVAAPDSSCSGCWRAVFAVAAAAVVQMMTCQVK